MKWLRQRFCEHIYKRIDIIDLNRKEVTEIFKIPYDMAASKLECIKCGHTKLEEWKRYTV